MTGRSRVAQVVGLGQIEIVEREIPELQPQDMLAQRVLAEQYEVQEDGTVALRPSEAVSAQSLQSPHDPEATCRVKGGTAYRGGYVVNVSETCAPENPVQLVTDVQVAPNRADDGELLERSLDGQADRGILVEKVTVDGGYTGLVAEQACEEHRVDLRATRMRGGTVFIWPSRPSFAPTTLGPCPEKFLVFAVEPRRIASLENLTERWIVASSRDLTFQGTRVLPDER